MDIANSKTGQKRKKRGRSTPEERFNRAWRRVEKQQKKNAAFMDEVERFAGKVEQRIEERERRAVDSMYSVCEHLIGFYRRKSLAQWQREALLDWLGEYLVAIAASPFADHVDIGALQRKCAETIEAVHPPELGAAPDEPEEAPPGREDNRAGRESQTEDMFEDLFGEFAGGDEADDEAFDHQDEEEPFDEFFRERREYEQARKDKAQSLSRLLKSTSVNTLFRKLARVLHPDREQDEAARERKNQLMGELSKARDENDIPKIFSLYADHVGESPLAEIDGDIDALTRLLEERYQFLREQEQEMLASNPRLATIYERFYHKSPRVVQRAIDEHLDELGEMIESHDQLLTQVTSVNKLKPLLEQRRAMNMFDEVAAEFEAMYK
jgi:hypothetical protein